MPLLRYSRSNGEVAINPSYVMVVYPHPTSRQFTNIKLPDETVTVTAPYETVLDDIDHLLTFRERPATN